MRQINRHPTPGMRLMLVMLPFVLLLAAYFFGSAVRLEANPQDKLLPGLQQMLDALSRMAFTPDKRSGDYLFWVDTLVSLARLLTGLVIASIIGLCVGVTAGVFPLWRASLSPLMTVLSMIPPLAILPVLFIVFGLDELSKVMLIVIGITPMLARDLGIARAKSTGDSDQSPDAGCQQLDAGVARGASAAVIAAADLAASAAGVGMVVSHFGRGHLLNRRAGLSHFPRAPLYGDGCDHSVRPVDHAAGLADGSGPAPVT